MESKNYYNNKNQGRYPQQDQAYNPEGRSHNAKPSYNNQNYQSRPQNARYENENRDFNSHRPHQGAQQHEGRGNNYNQGPRPAFNAQPQARILHKDEQIQLMTNQFKMRVSPDMHIFVYDFRVWDKEENKEVEDHYIINKILGRNKKTLTEALSIHVCSGFNVFCL